MQDVSVEVSHFLDKLLSLKVGDGQGRIDLDSFLQLLESFFPGLEPLISRWDPKLCRWLDPTEFLQSQTPPTKSYVWTASQVGDQYFPQKDGRRDYYFLSSNVWVSWLKHQADRVPLVVKKSLIRYLALEIENIQLGKLVFRDPLTGLFNDRHLQWVLEKEISRCQRYGSQFSLVYFDLNRFKSINDCYGHQVGDRALIHFANKLLKCVRNHDTVVRQGGDEFVAILLHSDTVRARSIIRRVHKILSAEPLETPRGKKLFLSVSAGTACFPVDGSTAGELLHLADKEMYFKKGELVQLPFQTFPLKKSDKVHLPN